MTGPDGEDRPPMSPQGDPGKQLSLSFPKPPPARGREDLIVAESNRDALALLDAWREQGEGAIALCGPEGCGKSHLAAIYAGEIGAALIVGGRADKALAAYAPGPVVLEDVDRCADAEALMRLLSAAARPDAPLLMLTGRGDPEDWGAALKDAQTRLSAIPKAIVHTPDDVLMEGVLRKLFRDRQIRAADAAIAFAVKRLRRTFGALSAFVDAADALALAGNRAVTREIAQRVLTQLSDPPPNR